MRTRTLCFILPALFLCMTAVSSPAAVRFVVTYPKETLPDTFSGRVVVYLGKGGGEPRFGPNWFNPQPMYSAKFTRIQPMQPMTIDETAIGFPGKLSEIPAGEYTAQAVCDRNLGGRMIGGSPGNLYSEPQKVTITAGQEQTITLTCDKVVAERVFREIERVKEVKIESKLLSKFFGRPTYLRAAVALPEEFATQPDRKFPIIYEVPGFGGRHYNLSGASGSRRTVRNGEAFLYVVLDPDCPLGHSVFADSANNGQWGKALTTELIPAIEKQFRAFGTMPTRYVTGHSSGGWSSLYLQVTYPEVFGGCWSTSPDPVDFRDFQQIDLYGSASNMFTDSADNPRPLARTGDRPTILYKRFSDMERPIRGEQLGSFEAVFSPKGKDGTPRPLWNRDTGKIDPEVAEAWRKYDIGLTLRTRWKELEPKLRGKIHVYMGDMDTFYLEGAVKLLQQDMARLKAGVMIEIVPGDHGSMMTPALRTRMDEEMAAQFKKATAK